MKNKFNLKKNFFFLTSLFEITKYKKKNLFNFKKNIKKNFL
jgi:hypothetical protein